MGLIDAFDATWSAARATFGAGTPPEGSEFESSSRQLSQMHGMVKSATAGSAWTGKAADAYSAANSAHAAVIGELAHLDKRLATEISRTAAVVSSGRRNLDAIRDWVHSVAGSLPPTADPAQMLAPTVRRGLSEVSDVINRSNGDLNAIARRLDGLRDEYQALDKDAKANSPSPSPDVQNIWGRDKVVPGVPVRPLHDELTGEEWLIARQSPTLLDEYAEAKSQGWTFTSVPGKGTFTNARDKVINIDPDLAKNGPFQRMNALSHELGHALHNPPEDRSSKEAYVNSRLDGEGAAVMNTIKIEREILAAGGPEIIPPEENDDKFKRIYDSYVHAGSTPQAYQSAIRQIGQVYGTLTPSTDPSTNYREYYGRDYK